LCLGFHYDLKDLADHTEWLKYAATGCLGQLNSKVGAPDGANYTLNCTGGSRSSLQRFARSQNILAYMLLLDLSRKIFCKQRTLRCVLVPLVLGLVCARAGH
jgi:hypothetical protein